MLWRKIRWEREIEVLKVGEKVIKEGFPEAGFLKGEQVSPGGGESRQRAQNFTNSQSSQDEGASGIKPRVTPNPGGNRARPSLSSHCSSRV